MDPTTILGDSQWKWPIAAGLALGMYTVSKSAAKKRSPLPLPPGPKGLPIVGNVLQIPQTKPWLVYNEWAKQYGDVIYIEALGQGMVVLNTLSAAQGLLDKRSVTTSDRGYPPCFEIMNFDWAFALMPYGADWRTHRRVFHQSLNANEAPNYLPAIEKDCLAYLRNLADSPEKLFDHVRTYSGAVMMRISYGVDDFDYRDQMIEDAGTIVGRFSSTAMPGKMLVNAFPSLKHVPDWFPGTGWKQYLKEGADINKRLVSPPWRDAKVKLNNIPENEQLHSVAKGLIENLGPETDPGYDEKFKIAMNVAAQSYTAGANTTYCATGAIFAALLTHPEVQRKAQAAIDAVTGGDRLPIPADIDDIPYLEALVKEVTRWFTVSPLGVPHLSSEDEEFNGYFIPKGTLLMANSWAILHDPEVFQNPHEFRPERYLKDGKIDPTVLDPDLTAFGFGRRICPGRYIGKVILKFTVASVLSVFDIVPAKDANGNDIAPVLEQSTEVITSLKPYQCDVKPRSAKHAALLA